MGELKKTKKPQSEQAYYDERSKQHDADEKRKPKPLATPKMSGRERQLEEQFGDLTDMEYGPAGTLRPRGEGKPRVIDSVIGELHGRLTSDPTPVQLSEARANQIRRAHAQAAAGNQRITQVGENSLGEKGQWQQSTQGILGARMPALALSEEARMRAGVAAAANGWTGPLMGRQATLKQWQDTGDAGVMTDAPEHFVPDKRKMESKGLLARLLNVIE